MALMQADETRLGKIDALYKLRLDTYIPLPIIIVVGDQSSGKSAVLEALIKFPLAQDATLCTRFPTNFTFRRAPEESLAVSISPHKEEGRCISAEALKDFMAWASKFDHPSKLKDGAFLEIFQKASEAMDLAKEDERESRPHAFSFDVLNIAISGPDYEHFGVVDLPGLFRRKTDGTTTAEDIQYVRKLVSSYMENPRAIMLAVLPANSDGATQEIPELAETYDKDRSRTLGVLTKLDMVDVGVEQRIIDLVSKITTRSSLGYIAVRNRKPSEKETTIQQRNETEAKFFNSAPWSAIPADKKCIGSLRKRIDRLMLDISRKEFDHVFSDLEERLSRTIEDLSHLSAPRSTSRDQQVFLTKAATDFKSMTDHAIDAHYSRDTRFSNTSLRLATEIIRLNEDYSDRMFKEGTSRMFVTDEADDEEDTKGAVNSPAVPTPAEGEDDYLEDTNEAATPLAKPTSAESEDHYTEDIQKSLHKPKADQLPEIAKLKSRFKIPSHGPAKKQQRVKEWIRKAYKASRGFELGLPSSNVVPGLFKEQAESWRFIMQDHLLSIIYCMTIFMQDLLQAVFNDADIADKVWRRLRPEVDAKFAQAMAHGEFILDTELGGRLITLNHYFASNMQKAEAKRVEAGLANKPTYKSKHDETLVRIKDIHLGYTSNEDYVVNVIHDILKSYHKVARKRFVDAICIQAIDHFLLSSPQTPLEIFSTEWVLGLEERELDSLVGETEQIKETRARLTAEVADLEKGREVLLS